MPVSSVRIICVLRAIRAENSVGNAMASSNALVCRLCVPPRVAAIASTVVRMTLLYGSCSCNETPDVWQCVRSILERSSFAPSSFMTRCHKVRAARSFDTSMKKFMPIPKKKDSRPANASISKPEAIARCTYSLPSAMVKASSCTAVAPASCI